MTIANPRDIPGLLLWLSADSLSLAAGANVNTWNDLSGNNNHCTFGSGTDSGLFKYQPTGGPAGGPQIVLSGGGVSERMNLPAAIFSGVTAAEGFVGVKATNQNASLWNVSSGGGSMSHYPHSSGYYESFGLTAERPLITGTTSWATSWQQINTRAGSGNFVVSAASGAFTTYSASGKAIGFDITPKMLANSIYGMSGGISVVLLWNKVLTSGERADVNTWLAANPSGGLMGTPPNVPTGLNVTAITNSGGHLDWTAPASGPTPTGYDVRLNGAAEGTAGWADIGVATEHELVGLAANTAYLVEVRSVGAEGNSAWVSVLFTTWGAPFVKWWDGDSMEPAQLLGWWDGSAIQPAEVLGWWDGDSIEPIEFVSTLVSYPAAVLADAPLAYYRLGEASGTAMLDSSGSGRHGTYTAVTLGTAGLLNGDADKAATFNGTTSEGIVSNAAWMSPAAVTLEAIIRPDVDTGTHLITGRTNLGSSSDSNYQVYLYQDATRLCGHVRAGGVGSDLQGALGTVQPGVRTHVAITYNGANAVLYINGVAVSTITKTGALASGGTLPFVVGASSWSGLRYPGVLDEVAFFGTGLAAARIAAHCAAMGPDVGLIQQTRQKRAEGSTMAAHNLARADDWQIMVTASHATQDLATPTGWTSLHRVTSAHSALEVFYRLVTDANKAAAIAPTWGSDNAAHVRTYRGLPATPTILGSGSGGVSPSRTGTTGVVLRVTTAAQANTSGGGSKTFTPDAGLVNSTGVHNWNWYDGIVAGEEPSAASIPSRTATSAGADTAFPAYADIRLT